ncbi:helix-turn-helix transcriptional regulator [Paenibacillus sp. FSL M8-0228]|uniref:helix-turn-helix domain-containing protein n=1 Tax=Paenibacillus sp. FSL M8-0228 TaxID=2921620 RepID=UPI0030FA73BA
MDTNSFGEYLKSLREDKNMSIRQLSLYSGVSNAYISQLENGKRNIPKPEILKKICKPLGVTYEELMDRSGYLDDFKKNLPSELLEAAGENFLDFVDDFLVGYLKNNDNDLEIDDPRKFFDDLSLDTKISMFFNITNLGHDLIVVNDNGKKKVVFSPAKKTKIDLADENTLDNLDLYYEGMELTTEEKIEFLAIVRGIFSARRALKENQ